MKQELSTNRKKSETINILNNIETFEETYCKLVEFSRCKHLCVDQFRIQLSSYAEQYVSGLNRQQFFEAFKRQSILSLLLELIKRNKDPHLFVVVMKSLSIISFNLKERGEVEFFLSSNALSELLEFKVDRSGATETVQVYIQFLKSLVLKMVEHKCVSLFYNSKKPLFPFLWRVFSFYNQSEQLSRTTIKSIIVEVVKINDFTVKAYLNNFPHVLFLGLLARYMMDALSYCKNKKNTYYLDVVSDEMSFINDLITKVEQSTKAFVLNSLFYYPVKHLWSSLQRKEANTKNVLLLVLVLCFNTSTDTTLMQLIFVTFFVKRVPRQLHDFLKTNSKELYLYSFQSYKPQFESCRKIIQTHCEKTFNNFNTQIKQIGDEIIHFKSLEKQQTAVNKSINASKQALNYFFKSYSWEGYLINQMKTVSEIIGASVKLNTPVSHAYTNNIFKTFESMKTMEGNYQNLFYSSLIKNCSEESEALNMYLMVIIHLLKYQAWESVHSLIAQLFLKQLPDVLRCLNKNITLNGINNTLACFFICFNKLKRQQLIVIKQYIKPDLNSICKQSSTNLLESQFSDWEDYFQIFTTQQQELIQLKQSIYEVISHLDYNIVNEQCVKGDKSVANYYFMIRNIILLFNQGQNVTCDQLMREKESQYQIDFEAIQNINFIVNGRKASSIIRGRQLKIVQTDTSHVIYEGKLKKLNMKAIADKTIEINLQTHKIQIQFLSVEDKVLWAEKICSLSKKIEEIEVLIISDIVEKIPQL